MNELILNAGNVLLEDIRKDYGLYNSVRYNKNDYHYKEEELTKEGKRSDINYKEEVTDAILNLLDYEYEDDDYDNFKRSGNDFVSSNIFELLSFILSRDNYVRGKTKYNIKLHEDFETYCTSELLEELIKRISILIIADKEHLINRLAQYKIRDYLLYPLFYSNSVTISLQYHFLFNILCCYPDLFFILTDYIYFCSLLVSNKNTEISNTCLEKDVSYFSFYYNFAIKLTKNLDILSSYIIKKKNSEELFNYNNNKMYKDETFNFEDEAESIDQCLLNKELYIDVSLNILSLFSSFFKNDWKLCLFFSTFIDDKCFLNSFRNDEEYEERKKDIIVKQFFNREKNDDWLMCKIDGIYHYKEYLGKDLYLIFDYDVEYNEEIICYLKRKNCIQPSVNDSNENNYVSIYEESKENDVSDNKKERCNDSFSYEDSSESLKKIEQDEDEDERLSTFSKNDNIIPTFINFIISCLRSEIDIIREYALIALCSLLDKDKNDKEGGKEIGTSVIYMLLCNINEWGILDELKYVVNISINKKMKFYIDDNLQNKITELNVFNLFYIFVEDCFDMSIILNEEKRKESIINDFCDENTLKWISFFYEYKEEREKVIRLLYIFISCTSEDVVYSLFSFEDSSIVLLLLENNETYNFSCMVYQFLYYLFNFFLFF